MRRRLWEHRVVNARRLLQIAAIRGKRGFSASANPKNLRIRTTFPRFPDANAVKSLLSAAEIQSGVDRLAARIAVEYAESSLTLIGVMTGSVVLLADLMRRIDLPMRVGVVQARSYRGGETRPGELEVHTELVPDVCDRDVLIVDDIFDTGRTLAALVEQFQRLGARSVRSCVLLSKPARVEVEYRPEYVAFQIPDAFVVGYGMDYLDAYRNLPYIAVLEEGELPGDGRP